MSQSQIITSKGHYIAGQWVKGTGSHFDSINPAYGTVLWQGFNATKEEVNKACKKAREALNSWSATAFEQRAEYTQKFAQRIELERNSLALLISQETGKPLWESQTEVSSVVAKINTSIQAAKERTWPQQTANSDAQACLRFKPQGIVVVLGAFNFPAHLSNGHIIPALLAGNTILYKPSEHCPAVAEFIMQIWHDCGIPQGVINCLQGDASVGSHLLAQDIQGVYFTGSYATGLKIHKQFSDRPEVILALEMGGNNPLVIDEVSDLKAAVYTTILSTILTSGQRCTCARRVIIPSSAQGDEFLQRLIKAYTSLSIGPYDSKPEPFMGPVISYQQALKHLEAQSNLIQQGGVPLAPMRLLKEHTGFLSPGIIDMTQVPNPPDVEIFAPLIQVYRYTSFEQALELAQKTAYGLAAGLLSTNPARYEAFYQAIRAGLINWNKPTTGASSNLPFGGAGLSGNHRPSAYYAADYCAYPVSSMEHNLLSIPEQLLPGLILD